MMCLSDKITFESFSYLGISIFCSHDSRRMKNKEVKATSVASIPSGMSKLGLEWIAAGLGCAIADSAMNPLEIMKVRLQAKGGNGSVLSLPRLFNEGKNIVGKEGIYGIYVPGLLATGMRGFFYAGFRIGMYPIVRNTFQNGLNKSGDNFLVKLGAGGITGAVGSFIFNPIDVVRVRFQKNPHAYPSTINAFSLILRSEGMTGLWSGGTASMTRSAMLSGVQLASYETIKRFAVTSLGFDDNVKLQMFASISSGIIAQGLIMPIDTIKTRIMIETHSSSSSGSSSSSSSSGGGGYRSISIRECGSMLFKEGGIKAFYRGFIPAIARQAPCMLIQMPMIEQLRKLFGLEYL